MRIDDDVAKVLPPAAECDDLAATNRPKKKSRAEKARTTDTQSDAVSPVDLTGEHEPAHATQALPRDPLDRTAEFSSRDACARIHPKTMHSIVCAAKKRLLGCVGSHTVGLACLHYTIRHYTALCAGVCEHAQLITS